MLLDRPLVAGGFVSCTVALSTTQLLQAERRPPPLLCDTLRRLTHLLSCAIDIT